MNGTRPDERASRYQAAYRAAYDDVLRFVQRRCAPDAAEDVVAEAMLVAWRRVDESAEPGGGIRGTAQENFRPLRPT